MTEINRAGQNDSLGHLDTSQGTFREQIDALTDTVRQLGGNPDIGAGIVNDPLSAPFVLYVNAFIGSDTFVSGDYADADDGSFEQKMRRISLQRLECGYTQARPFRTLSRAIIEAGIITSRDFLDLTPAPCGDLVSIMVAPGIHTALNGPGGTVKEWADGKEPTEAELEAFNPTDGGIVLPRGCSVVSLDLRKTIIRPSTVPVAADELPDASNRRAIFLVTGGCYLYGFTLMDKEGLAKSHHLLDGFQFAGKTQLDEFYAKIRAAFDGSGATGNLDPAYAVTRTSEFYIVGPQPSLPVKSVDTVRSSSPYIYNISIRSEYGLCGMWADGARAADSFRSMVVAQYTGVSLNKDLDCWQKYNRGTWGSFVDYADFIATGPDDVRPNPNRRSFHVRTSNGAIIQEVSVFAIGQSVHHWAESGSQITITNSNSNFGNVAALADGFQPVAAPEDGPWDIEAVRCALDPFEKTSNIKRVFLGQVDASVSNTATTIKLTFDLSGTLKQPNQPELLTRDGYSLKEDDYLWIENSGGADYRALLADTPWSPARPDEIKVKAIFKTDNLDGNYNPDDANVDSNIYTDIAGQRVYARRFRDLRTV